jgi:ABC-type polar amino acid transport system ATPase subunit
MMRAVLELDEVHLVRGTRTILDGASLAAGRGELVVLKGPSGSGKTTILRAIAALEPFQGGRIVVDAVTLRAGGAAAGDAVRALRRKVGMVFQFHHLFEHLSALDNVCLAPVHALGMARREAERRARELLLAFGVDHRAAALPRELSGGEAQRVAIARALAIDPQMLLMDEPTASLDPARRSDLAALLRTLTAEGRTLVVATHDDEFARASATRVFEMNDGRLVDRGTSA